MTNHCIEWKGYRTRDGYGRQRIGEKLYLSHRVSYCKYHGLELHEIDGLLVRHTCDNPPCINPEHLEIGTQFDNMRDMKSRGRNVPRSKITPQQVLEIRCRHDRKSTENNSHALAKEFGVSKVQINRIIARSTWPEL
nr:HNH endonuclease [Serratia marcescens]